MNTTLADALNSLRPGAEWTCGQTYDSIVWLDQAQTLPAEAEITAEIARLEALYVQNEYQRQRAREYPSWEDQMDLLYHQGYEGWHAAIKAVKDKYPKPE